MKPRCWEKVRIGGKPKGVGGEFQTNWYWLNDAGPEKQNLFRAMFTNATPDMGILGMFTFDYFPGFKEVSETGLEALVEMCEKSGEKPEQPNFDHTTPSSLLAVNSLSEQDRKTLITESVPGLMPGSGSLPELPKILEATALMVSVNRCYWPFPTRVNYDWDEQAQNADYEQIRWQNPKEEPGCDNIDTFQSQVALLLGVRNDTHQKTGYVINKDAGGESCQHVLPGLQAFNWPEKGECKITAILQPESVLNPSKEDVKILFCPITYPGDKTPKVFWTWYGVSGRPVVFMQSHSSTEGTGLNLADYFDWIPGKKAEDKSIYKVPAVCEGQPKEDVPDYCHKCHMPYVMELKEYRHRNPQYYFQSDKSKE